MGTPTIEGLTKQLEGARKRGDKALERVQTVEGLLRTANADLAETKKALAGAVEEKGQLAASLGTATADLAEAQKALATAMEENGRLAAGRDTANADLAEARKALEAADNETVRLAASLRATKGAATKARNEAAVLKLERSPVRRNAGPLKDAADQELIALALAEGEVEIVFSDGRRELTELAPIAVTGDAWHATPRGTLLREPVLLEPGEMRGDHVKLAGFALFANGEQLAWCQLPSPIKVPSGGRMELSRTIIF